MAKRRYLIYDCPINPKERGLRAGCWVTLLGLNGASQVIGWVKGKEALLRTQSF